MLTSAVRVVHLELRRRHFRMVLLVAEAQRALHLGGGVDERPERIARQRVVVAARADQFESARLVVMTFGLVAFEEEALDFVGRIEHRAVLGEFLLRVGLQLQAHVGDVRRAVLLEHVGEDQDLAGAEDVRRQPVEGRPVDAQPQVRLGLLREAANRGPIEGEVVGRLEQELLVVVEDVQPAFEVREAHGDGLDALLVGQVLRVLLAQFVGGRAVQPGLLGGQVHFFELVVRDFEKVAQRRGHRPWSPKDKVNDLYHKHWQYRDKTLQL